MKKIILSLLVILFSSSLFAANRDLLFQQGFAVDADNKPLTGSLKVTFRLYPSPESESSLWEETQSISFDSGVYTASLGNDVAIPSSVYDEDDLYLGMQIDGDDELSPRQALFSVPFAQQCETAVTAQSLLDNSVTTVSIAPGAVTSSQLSAGSVGSSALASTGVVAGTYSLSTITVDEDGRITSAINGASSATINNIVASSGLVGGGASGTVTLSLSPDVSLLGSSIDLGSEVTGTLVDSHLSPNVSLLGASIESSEITDLSASKITGTLTDAQISDILTASILNSSTQDGIALNAYGTGAGNTGEIRFGELVANGSEYVGFKSPDSVGASVIWTLPHLDGSNGQFLITDGTGNLSWTSISGSSLTNLDASHLSTGTISDTRLSSNVSLLGSSIDSSEITDGTIMNTDISPSAAIAWSKINKAGALPGDIGAAALLHTHASSDIVGELIDSQVSDTLTLGAASTVSDAALSTNVSKLGSTIESSEITDGTITEADFNASVAGNGLFGGAGTALSVQVGNGLQIISDAINLDTETTGSTATISSNSGIETTPAGIRMLGGCSNGQVLRWNSVGSVWECSTPATGLTGSYIPDQILSRKTGYAYPITAAATTFTAVGISGPTVSGTASAQPALGSRMYVRYASAATANAVAGHIGAANLTRSAFRPKLSSVIMMDSTLDSRRVWVGLSESSLANLNPTLTPVASAIDYVALGFNVGVNANWLCCSGDGTNHSCSDTGVPVTASTEYTVSVDWSVFGNLVCTVNGASVSKNSYLSSGAVNIGLYNAMTTLTATARNHQIAKYSLEQN